MRLFTKKLPPKELVTCPSCGHEQKDYPSANATFCHRCGTRILLQEKPRRQAVRKQVELKARRRMVACLHCGREMRIHEEAQKWQCTSCSAYVDLANHDIQREHTASIQTYGDIVVGAKGVLAGAKAEAENIRMAGRAMPRVVCRKCLVIEGTVKLAAGAEGPLLQVLENTSLGAEGLLEFEMMEVKGQVQGKQVKVLGSLEIFPGASLQADQISARRILVHPLGKLLGYVQSLTAAEIVT